MFVVFFSMTDSLLVLYALSSVRPSLVPLASLGAEANKNTAGKAKSVAYSRHLQPVDWSQFAREDSVSNGIIDEME